MSRRIEKYQPDAFPSASLIGTCFTHTSSRQQGGVLSSSQDSSLGEAVGPGDMRAQIRQVGENLQLALAAAGASLDDLIKTTTFVVDIDEFFRHVDLRATYLGAALPASTTAEVRRLCHPDLMVEIEAVAMADA